MRRRPARRSAAGWHVRTRPIRQEQSTDALRDPINLAPARRGDGHEGEGTNALRVLLCVRQRERGSPGNPGDAAQASIPRVRRTASMSSMSC